MFGQQPVLERRCVAVDHDGMASVMTVFEYDQVQRWALDRPPWAVPLPRWARDLPPVQALTTDKVSATPWGATPRICDWADYAAQMLHLLGLGSVPADVIRR